MIVYNKKYVFYQNNWWLRCKGQVGVVVKSIKCDRIYIIVILTSFGKLKFFHSNQNFCHNEILVTLNPICSNCNEVSYLCKLLDLEVREVSNGNEILLDEFVSVEDRECLSNIERALLKLGDNKFELYLKDPIVQIGSTSYFFDGRLNEDELILTTYGINEKQAEPQMTFDSVSFCLVCQAQPSPIPSLADYLEAYKSIEERVDSIIVEDVISSFKIEVERILIPKTGGDDRYYVRYNTTCEQYDSYFQYIMPPNNTRLYEDWGYVVHYETQEAKNEWDQFAKDETMRIRNNAMLQYQKKNHVAYLLAEYIRNQESKYYNHMNTLDKQRDEAVRIWHLRKELNLGINEKNYEQCIKEFNEKVSNIIWK